MLDLLGNEAFSLIRTSKMGTTFIFIIPTTVGICYAWYSYNYYTIYFMKYFPGIWWILLILITSFGSVFFGFMSTIMMGCQGLLMNAAIAVGLSHQELSKRFNKVVTKQQEFQDKPTIDELRPLTVSSIDGKTESKDSHSLINEKSMIKLFSKAHMLSVQQEKMDLVFSKMILLLSTYYLISITLFSYGFLIVLFTELNLFKTSSVLCHVLLFLFYMSTFFSLCSSGQDFIDGKMQTSDALNRVYFMFKGQFKRETENYFEFVKEKLEKPIALSPYSFFNLDRSGFLATMAIVFTYLIVLVQFKTAE